MTFVILFFRPLKVPGPTVVGSYRPVPSETTQASDSLGQSSLHSWIAIAVGLLASRPPS